MKILSTKKEEPQLVPNTFQNIETTLEDLRGFLGINYNEDDVENALKNQPPQDHMLISNTEGHEFVGWDFSSSSWEINNEVFPTDEEKDENFNPTHDDNVKKEAGSSFGFWDENSNVMEETKVSLNLNLNYEEVLEAWSNRGSLWAHHHHPNYPYFGEVPNLEEERTRRETRVLRYKEKRQSRLFSKKIRYQVRKLNADKRPRLKGRFVKRVPDNKMSKGG